MRAQIEPQNKVQISSAMPIFVNQLVNEKESLISELNMMNNTMKKTVANSDNLFETKESTKKKVAFTKEVVKDNIRAIITDDKDLKEQYYKMRHESYRGEYNWVNYDGMESENDRNGEIVVVLNDKNKVIGGCRLMIANGDNQMLSNEVKGTEFNYPNLLDSMGLDKRFPYSEGSAVVVEMGSRNSKITEAILNLCVNRSVDFGCKYMFGVAVIPCCRDYRKIFRRFERDVVIATNFMWHQSETYNNAKLFPMITKF